MPNDNDGTPTGNGHWRRRLLAFSEVLRTGGYSLLARDRQGEPRGDRRHADKLKVAVCDYLLSVNAEDPAHPFIPPTAINWLGDGIVSAVLQVEESHG